MAVVASAVQAETIGMVTGSKTGTYYALGKDMAAVTNSAGLSVEVKESGGSVDNINRIASGENAALGIVQSDVLGFLKRSKNPSSIKIAENVRMVFPLHHEEIHLIARREIQSFADLEGKRVIVGDEGSGSLITAVNLFSLTGVTPSQMLKISPPEGMVAVLKDQADAMFFVGGKPVKMFKNMEQLHDADAESASLLDQLHFVPLNDAAMLREYSPAEITPQDYLFAKETVPTLAVMSLLVSYDFSTPVSGYAKTRCNRLAQFSASMRKGLGWLQANGHAKWKSIDLDAEPGIWKRDNCAWPLMQKSAVTKEKAPAKTNPLEKDLLNIIKGE